MLSNFGKSGRLDVVQVSVELVVVTFTYKRVLGAQWVTACSALETRVWFLSLEYISSHHL